MTQPLLGRLLSSSNKTIDIVEPIFSPDLHRPLNLGVYIRETKVIEKLGDALHIKLMMIVVRSVDGSTFCFLWN